MSHDKPSLLFVHGAFTGAWCWEEHFVPWFQDRGFDARAIDLPGRRNRPDFDDLQSFSIGDYTDAVLDAVDDFKSPPIVVGHSMGGFLGWKAAEARRLAGLIMMAPVPPTGLAAPAMQLLMTNPVLYVDVARVHAGGEADVDTLHQALFSQAVPTADVAKYLLRFQPESRLAVLGLYANMFPNVMSVWGTPIKVVGASEDPLIPPAHVHWTASMTGTLADIYPNMGHGMMLEPGWENVAQDIADWMVHRFGLSPV